MTVLIYIYAGVFCAVGIQAIRENLRFGTPIWRVSLGMVADALGVAGLFLYTQPELELETRLGWRWVLALLSIVAFMRLFQNGPTRWARVLPPGERADAQLRILIVSWIAMVALASLPYFYMNAAVAFDWP
ncbi:MAG: hypothetical protein ACYTFV_16720 [Planctomycetota bacterium]|jgi:hypothetical protein